MSKAALAVIGVLVLAGLAIGSWFFGIRNQTVTKKETLAANWAQVDVVLQRRADLIPNLVETVKGYAAHEEGIFTALANARAAMMGARNPAERIAADQQIES